MFSPAVNILICRLWDNGATIPRLLAELNSLRSNFNSSRLVSVRPVTHARRTGSLLLDFNRYGHLSILIGVEGTQRCPRSAASMLSQAAYAQTCAAPLLHVSVFRWMKELVQLNPGCRFNAAFLLSADARACVRFIYWCADTPAGLC